METLPKQECKACEGLLSDIQKETGKYRRNFEQIVKNLDCQNNYICLPITRLRKNKTKDK